MTIHADGVVERAGDQYVIRFQRRLNHSVERVWRALTTPQELLNWWGDVTIDLVPGGDFTVRWLNTDDQGNSFTMHATITALEPPCLLETSGDGHGVLRWELRPDGDATVLTFSSTLDLPDEFRMLAPTGWHLHLDALAAVLDGGSVDLVKIPGWEGIHEAYVAKLSSPN
jgi:uncharacterized protein YndB with AHSA1/START domain